MVTGLYFGNGNYSTQLAKWVTARELQTCGAARHLLVGRRGGKKPLSREGMSAGAAFEHISWVGNVKCDRGMLIQRARV